MIEYGKVAQSYDDLGGPKELFENGIEKTEILSKVNPDDDGNIVVDMSLLNESETTLVNPQYLVFLCAYLRNDDKYSDDALLIYQNESEHIKTKRTSDLELSDSNSLCRLEATVMDVGDRRMNELKSVYYCQNRHLAVRQNERWRTEHQKPTRCNDDECSAPILKASRNMSDSIHIDIQQIVLGEIGKDDKNSTRIVGEVDRHLIGDVNRRDNVKLWAIPRIADGDSQKKKFYLHILGIESTDDDINLDENTVANIQSIAEEKEDIIQYLADSVAPTIVPKVGHDTARKAILASIVRGNENAADEKTTVNVLLYGKPGTGKSDLIQEAVNITPTSKYIDASQSTSAGILGTVVQEDTIDNDNNSWITVAGAIPQCHTGLVAVDELDKAGQNTQKALNTPMQNGKVVIEKAGNGDLPADTTIVAACNPEHETYMGEAPIESMNINRSLKDRFDIIVRVDDEISSSASKERKFLEEKQRRKSNGVDGVMDEDVLKSYLAYARTLNPKFSDAAQKAIVDKLLELRVASRDVHLDGFEISGRAQGKLNRLSAAIAKLRLANVITVEDVERAWQLIRDCWQSLTFDAFKFENDFDLMTAASIASNPSQQQVMRQTLGALNVAQNDENIVLKDIVYGAVDADNQTADWALSTLEDRGHIQINDNEISVLDLPA